MTVASDELVERVATALALGSRVTFRERALARAAIAALSTPEFVLPLAEDVLRGKDVYFWEDGACEVKGFDVEPGKFAESFTKHYGAGKAEG